MNRDLETLSAFLDGETSELETRRVMRDIDDSELDTLARWQLASDVMHGQASMAVPAGFNASLSAALADEAVPARRPAWLGGMARLAVAGSVAGSYSQLTLPTIYPCVVSWGRGAFKRKRYM